MMSQKTLSIYIHLPWCVRRCPYCDFNAYAKRGPLPEEAYLKALQSEFMAFQSIWANRRIVSLYFGGGTPSLCSPGMIGSIIDFIDQAVGIEASAEITLEANPGTVDHAHFSGYLKAGVNRLSLGVQSFNEVALKRLGRIHDAAQAYHAIDLARTLGFRSYNIDIMYGLPDQTLEEARLDLKQAVDCGPNHISWYQLTLEPQTYFYKHPPAIPKHDEAASMMDMGLAFLTESGYARYEISAYAKDGAYAQHNKRYWLFDDYLGLGAGAHSKWQDEAGRSFRRENIKHPLRYQDNPTAATSESIASDQLPIEFALNFFRLNAFLPWSMFEAKTGLSAVHLKNALKQANQMQLVQHHDQGTQITKKGFLFYNDLISSMLDT
jgi:putative oxygen-independent coproporphyrinogen III oxidase